MYKASREEIPLTKEHKATRSGPRQNVPLVTASPQGSKCPHNYLCHAYELLDTSNAKALGVQGWGKKRNGREVRSFLWPRK